MATRPQWILELHPDFPSSLLVLERRPEALVLQREDVVKGNWPDLSGPVVGYGTMFSMTRLRRHPRLGLAVSDDYRLLRCSSYYRWTYDLLGRNCLLVPVDALASLPLQRIFGSHFFLRSDSNYKIFTAATHSTDHLPDWLQDHAGELAVISEVIPILQEYRCFCRHGHFVCGSSYPEEPYREVPVEVRLMAEKAAQRMHHQGLNLCTVDIATCPDGRLRLIEIGGVHSWGLYGSDPDAFIDALEAEALDC